MHKGERRKNTMHNVMKEKNPWPETKTSKGTNSRCIAVKFVSITTTAVASNAEVHVSSEEFAGTWQRTDMPSWGTSSKQM
jgi:hypothetical protein